MNSNLLASGEFDPLYETVVVSSRLHFPGFRQVCLVVASYLMISITILVAARIESRFEYASHYGLRMLMLAGLLLIYWLVFLTLIYSLFMAVLWSLYRDSVRVRWRGVLFVYFAGWTWFIAAVLLLFWHVFRDRTSYGSFILSIIFGLIGFTLFPKGSRLFKRAKEYLMRSADDVLQANSGSVVLYLRSFEADSLLDPGYQGSIPQLGRGLLKLSRPTFWAENRELTFEEVICKGLGTVAPVVAIGKPGEHLPELGAFRKYVPGETWREEVQQLMDLSLFVCLLVGKSEGLMWEFGQLAERSDGHKVLLLLPPRENSALLWEEFVRLAGRFWVGSFLPPRVPAHTLAIGFRGGWKPVLFVGREDARTYREIAAWIRENISHTDRTVAAFQ